MARKTGQIIRRGPQMWMIRIYVGCEPETRKRKYIGKSIHGTLRGAQAHLNRMLAERDLGRNIRSSRQILDQYLDLWLNICARPRLRAKSFRDYSGLLARYVRPRLGAGSLQELSPAITVSKTLERRKAGWGFEDTKPERSRRMIKLRKWVIALLCKLECEARTAEAGPGDLVFTSYRGGPIQETKFVGRYFKPLLKSAGLPNIRLYDLRHTAATLGLAAGSRQRS
jgi:hypothetical protein